MTTPPKQLPDESDLAFAKFTGWLLSDPRRPPQPQDEDLALEFDWARRAAEYDFRRQDRGAAIVAVDQKESTQRNVERLVALEVQKYLHRSESSIGAPVLTPAELIRLYSLMVGKGNTTVDVDLEVKHNEKADLTGLSDEDLSELERILRK